MHTTNAYAYNSVTQENNKKNQTVDKKQQSINVNGVQWILQVADVSQKLGASLQLGDSLVNQSQKNKPVSNDADPTSLLALSSGQTDAQATNCSTVTLYVMDLFIRKLLLLVTVNIVSVLRNFTVWLYVSREFVIIFCL